MQSASGLFRIVQIADVHLGESAEADEQSLSMIGGLLDLEQSVSFAVLSGDQLTGQYVESNATELWRTLTDVLSQRSIPHTACLGNHDAERYQTAAQREAQREAHLTKAEEEKIQAEPGAATSRGELLRADMQLPLSLSATAPAALTPATSTYVIDVLLPEGHIPLLTLIHLDTGGGGVPQTVGFDQVAWLQTELKTRRQSYGTAVPPVIIFQHIPLDAFNKAWQEGHCIGSRLQTIRSPYEASHNLIEGGEAALKALSHLWSISAEVLAVFTGHDHGNDFCCTLNATNLCYARKSGMGGYVFKVGGQDMVGMRFIDFSYSPSGWSLQTHITDRNGSQVLHRALGSRSELSVSLVSGS